METASFIEDKITLFIYKFEKIDSKCRNKYKN